MTKKKERTIKQIIIHGSNSKFGNAALIDHWHRSRKPKPFDKIGYHVVIGNGWITPDLYDPMFDGCVESGRHFMEVGAHAIGHNEDSLSLCLIGQNGVYSASQLGAVKNVVANWKEMFPTIEEVKLHSDYNKNKPNCPGFTVDNLLGAILG